MSWQSARDSAALLAERLKLFDRSRGAERRGKGGTGEPRAKQAKGPEPYFVKPSRHLEPAPAPEPVAAPVSLADAITAELADADLIETGVAAPAPLDEAEVEDAHDEQADGRRAPRKMQTLPAYLTAPGMTNAISARVLDMSATGAKIELTPMGRATGIPMTELPDRFILVLRHDKMEVDCETVWRDEWLVGVRFLGFPRPSRVAAAPAPRSK